MRLLLLRAMNGATTSARNADRPPERLVDDRPLGPARERTALPSSPTNSMCRSNRAPLRRLADPGPGGDPVALERGAQIIDLVPHHDPEISVLVRRVGDRFANARPRPAASTAPTPHC